MSKSLLFILLATFAGSGYRIFLKFAGLAIDGFVGTAVINTVALSLAIAGCVSNSLQGNANNSHFSFKGVIFAAVVGLMAFGVDFFSLKVYGARIGLLPSTTILVTGELVIVTIFSVLYLHEPLPLIKSVGVVLGLLSCYILTRY